MTLSHAISNIDSYRKRYGFSKALRAIIHYGYIVMKKIKPNSIKNNTIEVNGYKIAVLPNDPFGTSAELLMFHSHEPLSTLIISKILKEGMVCLDIGGNIGYYVLLESKIVGKTGKVIAIEPSPINFDCLKKNIQLQNGNNVFAYNMAAGDKDSNVRFLIYEGAGNSCMVVPDGEVSKWPGKLISVPIRMMDTFLTEIDVEKIDFIRMDVEGYEKNVIAGLKNTIQKSKPVIHVEVHVNIMGIDKTKDLLETFKKEGYETIAYVPRDIDTPLIGTIRDIKKLTIDKILELLNSGKLPSFVMITLAHSSKNTSLKIS